MWMNDVDLVHKSDIILGYLNIYLSMEELEKTG